MEYSQKSVANIIGAYFFFLMATSIFIHATFMQLQYSPNSIPVLNYDLELALITRSTISQEALEAPIIVIDHNDLTGLKRVVKTKRRRNARRNRTATPTFVPATISPTLAVSYNALFDSLKTTETRSYIIAEAKKHLGLRYRRGGATPKGFDCSGFTSYVLAQKGVGVSRSSQYQSQQGQTIDLKNAKTGDLVFFSKYGKGGRVTHVAMVVDNKKEGLFVIHSTNRGIVVDNLMESSYWKPKMLYAKDVINRG